jgi:hypothetical protein
VAGAVQFVPAASLGTSYARLRPGRLPGRTTTMAELPLRVAEVTTGRYEVLDGHKRLAAWKAQGHTQVPVVVEPVASAVDHKRRLLAANAPPRTLTALDEARVVASLVEEDKLSPRTVALLCGRKTDWAARRLKLAHALGPQGCLRRPRPGTCFPRPQKPA